MIFVGGIFAHSCIAQMHTRERSFMIYPNCNFDINCSIGSPWAFQRDAVGQTVVGMEGRCSGTLINTSCQDLKPYFLTAEHCTSGSDQNPANMVFRFNYQSPTPACPGKTAGNEPPASTWITRNGATIIYSNWANKVTLLLLNGGRIGINPNESNLKMAGWDRISTPPTSGAVIHHPKYDAKKISIPSSMVTNGPNNTGLMFQVHFSQGIIEGGSSGWPLFNQHKRIVGVAEGFPAGSPEHNCSNNSTVFALFTRFSQVWANALGVYLDPTNQAISIDGISLPVINNNGSDVVCIADKQFNISNLMAGKTITWSVSPANLFAVSNGTGTIATLRSATSNSQGSAVLTFNLSQAGCDNVLLTRKIWVGKPVLPNTNPIGSPPIEIGIGQLKNISLVGHSYNSGAFPFTGSWVGFGSVSSISSNPTPGGTFIGNYQGSGNFSIVTSNNCGDSQIKWGAFNVSGPCNPCPRIIINNPVSNYLICEIPEDRLPIEIRSQLENINGDFQLLDQNGTILINEKFKTNIHSRDVNAFNNGVYFVNMKFNGTQLIEKVIIIK